jgi:hypothetical protein
MSILIFLKLRHRLHAVQMKTPTEILTYILAEIKIVQPLGKTIWEFHLELNLELPYNLAITLLGIYPSELKSYIHTQKNCSSLFIIAKS